MMIKILIIDDNKNNLIAEQALFSHSFPGALIITALSGKEGIEKSRKENPDVILLDLVMPIMDGIETCRILKDDDSLRHIPVIMLTAAKTDSKIRTKALQTGVESFLSKPIDEAELTAQVSSMIRLKKSETRIRNEKEMLEEQIRNRTRELEIELEERKLVEDALKVAVVNAESSNRLITAFMHNISHEVRTPLNGILGFSSLIIQPDYSEEEKAYYFSLIKSSSDRLLNTITNYMDISLIASGNLEVKFAPFDLHKVLVQLFNQYKPICANKKIALKLELPEITEHKILNADEELFQKAFSHLLDNAVKFTSKGFISFGYKSHPHLFEFFIKDTGVGIGEESITLIFESFKQEEALPHRGYEGSGLGLSIARGIVGLFGGDMRVESKKGFGSTFYFTIHHKGNKLDQELPLQTRDEIAIQRSPLILIAEDDESNLLFIETVLQSIGVPVLIANNGKDAVDLCRQHGEITLVLMDIKMPVMDGLEATREIKSFRKELPVIALTAFAMNLDKTRSLDAGCDDYLSKPFSGDALFEKLRKYGFLHP